MKTKLLTLTLLGILTLSSISCSEEEVAPSTKIQLNEKSISGSNLGGVTARDR